MIVACAVLALVVGAVLGASSCGMSRLGRRVGWFLTAVTVACAIALLTGAVR